MRKVANIEKPVLKFTIKLNLFKITMAILNMKEITKITILKITISPFAIILMLLHSIEHPMI